jgi:hypothetical protein
LRYLYSLFRFFFQSFFFSYRFFLLLHFTFYFCIFIPVHFSKRYFHFFQLIHARGLIRLSMTDRRLVLAFLFRLGSVVGISVWNSSKCAGSLVFQWRLRQLAFCSVYLFFNIQTFFYTIMNLFITLLENVNKSRTSANNVSLKKEFMKRLERSFCLCAWVSTLLKHTEASMHQYKVLNFSDDGFYIQLPYCRC